MKIRKRSHATKKGIKTSWQLDCGIINGKRVQLSFKTEADAKTERAARMEKLKRYGESSLSLSEDERIRFLAARDRLAAVDATIEEAVEHYLKTRPKLKEVITLGNALELCIAEKAALGARDRYIKQFRSSCNSFVAGRSDDDLIEISRDDVKRWITGNGWAPKTQQVYHGDLRTLFSWAIKEGYAVENPCWGIELAVEDPGEIRILGAAECERLLLCAATYWGPTWNKSAQAWVPGYRFLPLLGYAAIAIFVGVRPEEIQRLKRSALDLEGGTFAVTASVAKTRRRRVVDLPECALGWLRLWDEQCPGDWMIPPNYTRLWKTLRETAAVEWSHDVLRHTCASMHYALHEKESKTKALLGHSADEDTLFQNYRGLRLPDGRPLSRAEAERFYRLVRPGLFPLA